jgi:hypothetical protein
MKKIICFFRGHDWQYSYAPYVLYGNIGRIQAKICKRCGYKSPHGNFINDIPADAK